MKTTSTNNQEVGHADDGETIRTKVNAWENVLLITGIVITLIVTSMPLFFYLWDPPQEGIVSKQGQEEGACNLFSAGTCHPQNASVLVKSVCSTALNWKTPETAWESLSISSGCDSLINAEKDLGIIMAALASQASEKCRKSVVPLLCRSVYEKCGDSPTRISSDECMAVRDGDCFIEWRAIQQAQLPLSCFRFPNCSCYQPVNSTTVSSNNFSSEINFNCPWPSVPSRSRYAVGGCSPLCMSDQWAKPGQRDTLVAFIFIAVIFTFGGCIVVIMTWVQVKQLRSFPQIVTLFMILAYCIPFVGFLLPLLIGRERAYCNYDDVYNMWEDPTPVCQAQGFLVHFGFICALTWWMCSLFNIFISLACKNRPNPVRHHPKLLLMVETILSLLLPTAMSAIVFASDAGYGTFSVEIITCGPASIDMMYFTLALPLQIITYLGSIMVIYILKATKQRFSGQLPSVNTQKARRPSSLSSSQEALRRRFILLVIALPLCFSIIMTTFGVFNKLTEPTVRDYYAYLVCLRLGGDTSSCEAKHQQYGSLEVGIVAMFLFIVFSLSLFVYALAPRAARNYWKRFFRNLDFLGRLSCSKGEYNADEKQKKERNGTPVTVSTTSVTIERNTSNRNSPHN